MRIKPFQAVYPNLNYITSADSFFNTVKFEYPAYRKSGFFQKASQEAIYIYQIKSVERTFTGIIACADIRDYREGKIKKHEETLAAKEQQQMHLMISRNAVVKPVLLTYPTIKEISNLINQSIKKLPVFYSTKLEIEEQVHTFWEISDGASIQKFQQLFLKHVPETYIADGHHRTSTTSIMDKRMKKEKKEGRYDLLLSALFPASELAIFDYNRVVDGLNDFSMTTFMAKISQLFNIKILKKPRKPLRKHEIVMFINREWFSLKWKKKLLKKYEKEKVILDASLLDETVLKNILGIEDVKTDTRIKYVEGPLGLNELRLKTIKSENRVAFALYPVALSDLMKMSDAGKSMPPKSTWFEPRIKNGLMVLEF